MNGEYLPVEGPARFMNSASKFCMRHRPGRFQQAAVEALPAHRECIGGGTRAVSTVWQSMRGSMHRLEGA